jgi:hypothetical protein
MNKLASKLINILIFTTIFLGLTAGSCDPPKYDKPRYDSKIGEFTILTIDSCEYIVSGFGKSRNVTHKGNCKFCIDRNYTKDTVESCSIR